MLNNDYKEILQLLLDERADFLLVGAYALAAHGYPRSTGDIDILVRPSQENAEKVYRVILNFGAPIHDLTQDDLTKEGIIFQIGVAPRRIDFLTRISGVNYHEAEKDKVCIDVDGMPLPFISLETLIKNKEASARPKDLEDVKKLKKHLMPNQ